MRYPFSVYQTKVEDHVFWIAESPLLNGCIGQGETADDAIKELELNEEAWLETAEEYGIAIPEIPCEQVNLYSGKFTVRVSPHVHKTAAELAKKQGISLNQYVNDAIVSQNSSITTADSIMPVISDIIQKARMLASSAVTQSKVQYGSTISTAQTKPTLYKQILVNN